MESSNQKGKAHLPVDPELDPTLSDSSSRKFDSSDDIQWRKPWNTKKSDPDDDTNYSKSKRKKRNWKENRQKHKKHESPDSSLRNSDLSDNCDYIRKRQKNKKIHQKKYPIKLCARLTAKLLTTTYKSKIIKFKMDDDPLQHRIYFITLVESLYMIFYQLS